MSENITVNLFVDTTQAKSEISLFQDEVNRLDSESKTVFQRIQEEGRNTLRYLSSIVGLTRNVIRMLGITLEPMYEAILNSAFQAASTLVSIGIAYLALPGYGWAVYGVILAAALGMSIGANMAVAQTKETNRQQIDAMIATLNSVASLVNISGRY